MKRLINLILNYQLKNSRKSQKTGGFTLIELLVGIFMAFLVILPLLGFMINIMDTDRKEQAKNASEQEIQTALNYISRDLDQSVFIYDGLGLGKITTQLPTVPDGAPVLVFWKRKFLQNAVPTSNTGQKDDAFVYSLVSYYLIKDATCNASSPWSCTSRIARIELSDGVKDPNNPSKIPPPNISDPVDPNNFNYINENDPKIGRSTGFKLFNLSLANAASLEDKMNGWTNDGSSVPYPQPPILLDYIDQTLPTAGNLTPPACPTTGRPLPRPDGATDETTPYVYRPVPVATGFFDQQSSFYACVDADKTTAQVFIRGNALARNTPKTSSPTYADGVSAYFPRASVQVKGRGLIGGETANQ